MRKFLCALSALLICCLLAGQSSLYGSQITKYDNTSMRRVGPRI